MIEIPNYNLTVYINDVVPIASVDEAVRHQKGDYIHINGVRYVVKGVNYSVDIQSISVYMEKDD